MDYSKHVASPIRLKRIVGVGWDFARTDGEAALFDNRGAMFYKSLESYNMSPGVLAVLALLPILVVFVLIVLLRWPAT
ncbi:MAG: hypothetical protein PVF22_03630, partial [Candidatus Aminicenantes bacterium]